MEQQVRVNNRKSLSGRVVSTKNTKTIIVAVDIYIKHPLYGKRFRKTKKFLLVYRDWNRGQKVLHFL